MAELLDPNSLQALAWSLVHFLWQGALVALLVRGVLALTARHDVRWRYLVACVGLAVMALWPAATLIGGVAGGPEAAGFSEPGKIAWATGALARTLEPALPWIVTGWLFGVALLAAFHGRDAWRLRRLVRRRVEPLAGAGRRAAERLARRLAAGRPVRFLASGLARVPMVVDNWPLPSPPEHGSRPSGRDVELPEDPRMTPRHERNRQRTGTCCLLITFASFLVAATLPPPAAAASAERIAEERALAVVEAIAGGDADAIWTAFQENLQPATLERRPESSWRQLIEQLAEDLAGAEVRDVTIAGEELRVTAQAETRQVTFSFAIEAAEPHLLGGFSVALGGAGDGGDGPALEPDMERAEVTRAIDAFVDEKVEETGFSGTVLVAKDGEVWHRSAHGLAHRGYGIANHAGTRFDLGSINKMFTKVAVAQLAAAGKLGLDDTIADHLSDYPNPEVAARVTVRQLAEHTSGLGDVFVPAFTEASKTRFRQPEDFFPLFAHEPLLFEPGTGRQYSNAGYQVLGAIVAAASGTPYHDYVAEKVWAPAGMAATAFVARDEPTPDVAVGYTTRTEDGRLRNNLFRLPVVGSPAGSSFSTVDDMLRFAEALRGGSLVAEGWTAWLLAGDEPGAEALDPDQIALGFAGGAPGVNAMLRIAGPWTVVVLANQDPPVAGKLAQPLGHALERLGR